jgi:hypothetical protein
MMTWTPSTVATAFDDLVDRVVAIDKAWTYELQRSGLRCVFGDVGHHLSSALAQLEGLAPDEATYAGADDGTRFALRELRRVVLDGEPVAKVLAEPGP